MKAKDQLNEVIKIIEDKYHGAEVNKWLTRSMVLDALSATAQYNELVNAAIAEDAIMGDSSTF